GLFSHDPSGELTFTSRLVRDIVYDATPADVRRSLHAAAAAAVEALSPDVALLGHHHDLAGHAKESIMLLRRAGDHAAEQLDDVGAGQFYYRALVAVRQAVQSGDDDGSAEGQFVMLSVRLADVLRTRGETALARGVLAEARDWSGAPMLVAMIDRSSSAIAISEGDVDGAIAALRRGVGRAISTGDMNLVCELYLDLSTALLRAGDPETALRELVECIDLATLGEGFTAIVARLDKAGLKGLPPVQQLFETTRAYPGHIEHVVRYLLEGGKAEDTNISLPDLIAARLSMLKQSTRDVLQAAAVLGLEPQVDLLRSMLPSDTLESAMADAERAGLFSHDPSGELTFTSRLVRDIVYDATPADVRRSLHAAAAAAVEALSPDVALLGHHHDLAGHAKDAIMLLRRAGDHAAEQLDDIGAGQFYYRALVAVRHAVRSGDDDGSAEGQFVVLSVKLADVLRARGETALARGVLAEARDWSGAPMLVALIDRSSAAIALSEGDVEGAIAALRRGVGRAISTGDMNLVCELYLDLSTALLRAGDPTGALRELVECIDLATLGEGFTAIDGPEPFWRILRAQAQMVDNAGDSYRALRLGEAALFHAQRVRSRLGAARVQHLLAQLCDTTGLGGKADRYRQAAITEMRNLGDRRATAELLLNDAPTKPAITVPGRMDDAMQLTKESGWAEGHENAKRKSSPPSVKS
ncbi:MAG TPA: hypothetical protein VK607_04730, partial [Kofleriaceae bacterium]|nr:hypothetical protein [Kofleriaceae bacterium]